MTASLEAESRRVATLPLHDQHARWVLDETFSRRWPYGPPGFHEEGCRLHEAPGFCDCRASDESDEEFGGA